VKCGNGGICGFVGSVHIDIFIYMDMYEEMLRATAGPLLRRFWVHRRRECVCLIVCGLESSKMRQPKLQ
jgi:hypothetical protein